jgi:hypothetical protein
MFGTYFYNESMRRMTIGFGQIFNNIQIKRKNSSGDVVQSIRVPLAYAPKEKFLARLDQQANLGEREFSVTLPRMSFEISGISYDPSRKLTRVQKFKTVKSGIDGKVMNFNYTPVPYNVSYNLYSFTASAEAGLQIVEQIFFSQRRAVIYTLGFTAKTYLFGPASTQKVIKNVQSDAYTDTDQTNKAREVRIVITPDPTTADADDDFGFTTTISNFSDGKKYNTTTDSDE